MLTLLVELNHCCLTLVWVWYCGRVMSMPERNILAAAAAHWRGVVLWGCDTKRGSRGGDKTPEHMTSAMTQPPQRRIKHHTKCQQSSRLDGAIKVDYFHRRYLAQIHARRWPESAPSVLPPTKRGGCCIPCHLLRSTEICAKSSKKRRYLRRQLLTNSGSV